MKWLDAIIILCFLYLSVCSNAQSKLAKHDIDIDVPEVALLGLAAENEFDVLLSTVSPSEAGNEIELSDTQDKSIWINYSSIVRNQFHKRKVIAMVQGEMPSGLRLTVEASRAAEQGNGRLGEPVGKVTLTDQPADLIVNIGSCYTGRGAENGHYLTYRLEQDESMESYEMLTSEGASVSVLYTLTDIN